MFQYLRYNRHQIVQSAKFTTILRPRSYALFSKENPAIHQIKEGHKPVRVDDRYPGSVTVDSYLGGSNVSLVSVIQGKPGKCVEL